MSVDQVGADVCPRLRKPAMSGICGVRRSGWCRRLPPQPRRLPQPSQCVRRSGWCRRLPLAAHISRRHVSIVSVDQVGADVCPGVEDSRPALAPRCPSIRLVPTSAPTEPPGLRVALNVSVDQVGADVCPGALWGRAGDHSSVRRSGWCRRLPRGLAWDCGPASHVSVDQVGADVCPRTTIASRGAVFSCPSIRLVPTSAPAPHDLSYTGYDVSVDQVGADVCPMDLPRGLFELISCPSIRLVPTSAPW